MSLMRRVLLAGSTNAWLRERATKTAFVRKSVSRFMPGEQMDDALRASAELKPDGITTILTHLGVQISVKPTQLGLDLDRALCERNLDRLLEHAEQRNNFVWIDMESSPYVDPTLALFTRSRAKTPRIGIALQAYLYRTMKDVEALIPLGSAIRIVKGAYLEPADVAFPKKADTDENFFKLCTRLMQPDARAAGCLLHIATHDVPLSDRLSAWISQNNVPPSAYEFAMLYGIQRAQQLRLAREGKRLRVLISYGEYWFPWYMRRLAERPANVGFVLRNMIGG